MQLVTAKTCWDVPPSLLLPASGVYLRLAQAIQIRDVESVPGGGCVHAAGASLLQPQVLQDLVEARILKNHQRPQWRFGLAARPALKSVKGDV